MCISVTASFILGVVRVVPSLYHHPLEPFPVSMPLSLTFFNFYYSTKNQKTQKLFKKIFDLFLK